MDKIDRDIIKELLIDSRVPILRLAKKIRSSREVAAYRIKRLQKEGIIRDFISEIDISKLGFMGAAVFVNVKATHQKEFKEYLEKSPFVSWVAELSGVWSFGLSIIGRTNEEIDSRFSELYLHFKDAIIDHRFTLHKKNHFFYEKYLGEKPFKIKTKMKEQISKIDDKDKVILQELATDSRIDTLELSQKIRLTAPAVAARIKRLKSAGIIERFSIFVDASRLGLFQYSVFITNKDVERKEALISHLKDHPYVSFIAEYSGDPFIEFGVFVKNSYELRDILQGIEEAFPSNRVIELSLFQKEFVSIKPPKCVFASSQAR
ncbi:MAG: winged helix-turn-helix transcriptional regulator [archaeon]